MRPASSRHRDAAPNLSSHLHEDTEMCTTSSADTIAFDKGLDLKDASSGHDTPLMEDIEGSETYGTLHCQLAGDVIIDRWLRAAPHLCKR